MLSRIVALIIKEILAAIKDKKARFVLIVPPIIQLFIFAFAATLDVKNASIGILNRDSGEKAIELCQRFSGAPTFTKITYLPSVAEITPFIDTQKGMLVISIDENFSKNINAKKAVAIQLILDGRKSNTAQILAGYVNQIVEQYAKDTARQIGSRLQPTDLVIRSAYNPNLIYYWYNVPSLSGILTMLVGLVITAMSVAREREMGTFDQLLVSPLEPWEILIGKIVPAILIALAESLIIVLSGIYIFKIPFTGNLFVLYCSLCVFVTAITGIGLFISSLAKTQQQAVLGTFVFMSPAVLLSGFATPIENMPIYFQYITYINPLRYMLVIARGEFLKELPLEIILLNLWPMALIALCTLSCATWFFKRRLE